MRLSRKAKESKELISIYSQLDFIHNMQLKQTDSETQELISKEIDKLILLLVK